MVRNLLSGAVYSSHVAKREASRQQQWQQIWDDLVQDADVVPLMATIGGLVLGTLFIGLFLWCWLRPQQRQTKERQETMNFFSAITRGNDETLIQTRPAKKTKMRQSSGSGSSSWFSWLWVTKKAPASQITGPACYLVYEPDQGGRLVQHYSDAAVPNAVVIWKPAAHIPRHKWTDHEGRTTLVQQCSAGFHGRHNYCLGVCQFVKTAVASGGGQLQLTIDNWKPTSTTTKSNTTDDTSSSIDSSSGEDHPRLPVDVYLYRNDTRPSHQTLKLAPSSILVIPNNALAVACLPEKNPFFDEQRVDLYKWLTDAERVGSSTRFY